MRKHQCEVDPHLIGKIIKNPSINLSLQ